MFTALLGPILALHLFTAQACNLSYSVELQYDVGAAFTHVVLSP